MFLSNFLREFLLIEESFKLAGRSFYTVGPETLNDLGPNVIVLVLGMYSCPDVADRNCHTGTIRDGCHTQNVTV